MTPVFVEQSLISPGSANYSNDLIYTNMDLDFFQILKLDKKKNIYILKLLKMYLYYVIICDRN